eukprot:snap_masked-scaffold_4-processed-gene-16.35-mRNA-1 protein AED:0.32 eAED:0.32 QI:0/0/0/0.5/1/1/2/0/315
MSRLTKDIILNSSLNSIIQFGVGIEGVDFDAASQKGIYVQNTPSLQNASATAEHAVYLALASGRPPKSSEKAFLEGILGSPLSTQIDGKKVLVLGMGSVGENIIKRLASFSPNSIIGIKRNELSKEKLEYFSSLSNFFNFDFSCINMDLEVFRNGFEEQKDYSKEELSAFKALEEANYIFIACILTPETKLLVNEKFLNSVKAKCFIINVARGPIVSNTAMLRALEGNKVSFFASDVGCTKTKLVDGKLTDDLLGKPEPFSPDEGLYKHPNTFFTPHLGGSADGAYEQVSKTIVKNFISIYKSRKPCSWLNNIDK